MVRLLPVLVALFLGAGHAAAQDNGVSACSAGCISQVFGDTTKLSCPANDSVCACNNDNFWFAIRDCITQACTGENLAAQLDEAKTSAAVQCAAIEASAGVTAPLSSSTTATTVPATTPLPATTASPNTNTSPGPGPSPSPDHGSNASPTTSTAPTTSAATSTTTPVATTASPSIDAASSLRTSTTQDTDPQSSAASKTSASASLSSTSSSTSTSGAASVSSSSDVDASSTGNSSGDLGVAAKAGIGAGVGVALLLSAVVACCILARKRKRSPSRSPRSSRIPTMQISRPLPGSGRQYAHDVEAAKMSSLSTQFRKDYPSPIQPILYSPTASSSHYSPKSAYAPSRPSRDDDFNVQGRRYEDMLPRTQPRTMI
ncbi:hypothetical protein BKA67DRAFT_292292 [Truncatella angustata]|uniref:CFEM domain-containing protein n=1 Tax=Truncatella angustata TaxID=152316 RepID=A0A9P8UI78_9PEZI|nr:uncharacterized protein BKA67DRAFT_292292 [Truncatella angustata]KAH6652498.1 hypothetical protein BKA67DRAFT_292292 [Truncatella angustata]KAH8198991.1 hypothetical protein TruAng_006868 [Truncatella angustata]